MKVFVAIMIVVAVIAFADCSDKHLARSEREQREEVEALEKRANYYAAVARVKLDSATYLKSQQYDVATMNRILTEGSAYADSAITLMNKVLLLKSKL